MTTGNQALKMASMILVMPFLFVYTPLLLNSTTIDVTITVVACFLGVLAWARFLEGFDIGKRLPLERSLWLVVAILMLLPVGKLAGLFSGTDADFRYGAYAVGAALMALMFAYKLTGRRAVA